MSQKKNEKMYNKWNKMMFPSNNFKHSVELSRNCIKIH